jgi:cytochrome c
MDTRIAVLIPSVLININANAAEALRVDIPPGIQAEVKKLGCDACHGWNRTKFGPAWQDVADRYRGQSTYIYRGFNIDSAGEKLPLLQGLIKKVSKGGKGEWNEYIPMAPNDPNGLHSADIKDIVTFILSIPPQK